MSDTTQHSAGMSLEGVAEGFLAVGALVYASGFLVLLAFTDYLGAREAASDFFRAKYIHVGILCSAFPVIALGVSLGVLELGRRSMQRCPKKKPENTETPSTEQSPEVPRFYGSTVILIFNLLFVLYGFLMFGPRSFSRNHPLVIWLIFGTTFGGVLLINSLGRVFKEEYELSWQTVGRGILCIVIICGLDVYCFRGIVGKLSEMLYPEWFYPRGTYYFLFVGAIVYLVCRMRLISPKRDRSVNAASWVIVGCIVGPLYFLSVLAFAVGIYPYIPAGRGGGDYTESDHVVLYYKAVAHESIPPELDHGGKSQPLILVEESDTAVTVADPEDGGGPTEWRRGTGKPQIFSIIRDNLTAIVYQSRKLPSENAEKPIPSASPNGKGS